MVSDTPTRPAAADADRTFLFLFNARFPALFPVYIKSVLNCSCCSSDTGSAVMMDDGEKQSLGFCTKTKQNTKKVTKIDMKLANNSHCR